MSSTLHSQHHTSLTSFTTPLDHNPVHTSGSLLVSSPFSLSCSYSDSTRMSYAKHTNDTTLPKHICVRVASVVSEMYDAPQMGASFNTPLPHAIDLHNDLYSASIPMEPYCLPPVRNYTRSYFLRMIYIKRPRRTLIFSRVLSGNITICIPRMHR